MSTSRRHTKKPAPAASRLPNGKSGKRSLLRILPVILCLLPAVFFFAFGKYLEFSQPDPFDSGAYVYSAQHLLKGARLYVDEIPSAQPGTLLVNVLGVYFFGFNEIGPKIIQALLQAGALTALFFASRSLFGRAAAVFSVTAAAIYLSAPHIAKFGNTKEQYMIAFMVMAASFWIFYEQTGKNRWLLLTGAALIWPYYFKATGLTIDIAFSLYFLGRALPGGILRRQFQRELLMLIGGALIGIVPLAAFFLWQRRLGVLLNSFPILILNSVLVIDAVGIGVFYLMKIHPIQRLAKWSRQVRPAFWITGLMLIAATLAGTCLFFHIKHREDLRSYIDNLFFMRIYYGITLRAASYWGAVLDAAGLDSGYIGGSRKIFSLSKQAPIVLRYYRSLSLPVTAALLSIVSAVIARAARKRTGKISAGPQDRIVRLLALWWVLDMAFVWISPHSYEQYYLPPCASGAVLGGYAVWLFVRRMRQSPVKIPYFLTAAAAGAVMIGMVWPLVFGYRKSAYSGKPYVNSQTGRPDRQRGYAQALNQVRSGEGPWQKISNYIRQHSAETDRIYVWGWYPGIYVQAQRLAPVPKAFEGEMHTSAPRTLAARVHALVRQFEENPPVFIVDTRKYHFPFDRPPLELWPIVQMKQGGKVQTAFAPNDPEVLGQFEQSFGAFLEKQYGPEEAGRFEAVKPLRDYVMAHYRIVPEFSRSPHVLFERKD